MFGIYGIAACSDQLEPERRVIAFDRMSSRIDTAFFHTVSVATEHLNIGIILRNNHENKDIAIDQDGPNRIIGFSGYARIRGEKNYLWADEMIHVIRSNRTNDNASWLEKIEGSFECVISDGHSFLMMSDRFGSKKQFFAEYNNILVFGPDAGQIIATNVVPKAKNLDAAAQLLISGFFLDDSTLDKRIFRFPFASIMTKSLKRPEASRKRRYWYPPSGNGTITRQDNSLEESFTDAMQAAIWDLRKLSSKTIVPLSGGLDSRAIACFLSQKQRLNTLTYDFGDEVNVARKVSGVLDARHSIITNNEIMGEEFGTYLTDLIRHQYFQVVINQYFYAPLFYRQMARNDQFHGLYDGVFMGLLFSAPYIYPQFDYDKAKSVYGRGITIYSRFAQKMTPPFLEKIMKKQYEKICADAATFGQFDGYGLSQLFYISGRLRRYVCETYQSRENYGYVFKPGFDYRLSDMGFSLDLALRKGGLYQHVLKRHFSEVMQILFKDSYGNREPTRSEKIRSSYKKMRMKISGLSRGMLAYTPYQVDHYFLIMRNMDKLEDSFFNGNYIPEFFNEKEIQNIFNTAKRKFYLFNLVQRIQVVNNYYKAFEYA